MKKLYSPIFIIVSLLFIWEINHLNKGNSTELIKSNDSKKKSTGIKNQYRDFRKYNKVRKFDHFFRKYSKRYFGIGFDWKYFKAQAIAESQLDQNAKSNVGAQGIMQIMPRTFQEIKKKNKLIKGGSLVPKWNIAAGIFYNKQIWKKWSPKKTIKDKINFMFASYNAGRSNIIKAQKKAEEMGYDANDWLSIEVTLPHVTNKSSVETINYVKKINGIKAILY